MSETHALRSKDGTVITTVEFEPLTPQQKELLMKTELGRRTLKAREQEEILRKERKAYADEAAYRSAEGMAESRPNMSEAVKKGLQATELGRRSLKGMEPSKK